ncbi:Glutaredoxin [Penicillium canariense]|uniref:Glutaredoxin n=1 Tax=Penicillium canariense TaxID=189055 RepID=A0A9W9HW72_9EURO|nr:Glutaredoxin [Penicillium canariense]KAJ5157878.1 Glutaredoxin [Penicillium canariense]
MSDSTLYLYTSLTAGSSHIVTATARVETILKANKLPFRAIDVATDEVARKLWGRRSKGKKLPGLVKYGNIVGPTPALTPPRLQDLEEIEEWNEFGELRMVVNSVQDVDGMPATSNPVPATETTFSPAPKEPEPVTPKPCTIKIQSPPATKTAEKKDEQAVLAFRQASSEAASKAKNKAEEKKDEPKQEEAQAQSSLPTKTHRGSVACELPDITPDSSKGAKRPPLVPEIAAVSSANFHADNAEALGLVEHHRGSIISGSDNADKDKVVTEIRQSISAAEQPLGSLDALRKEAAGKPQEQSIEEEGPGVENAKEIAEVKEKDTPSEMKEEKKDTPSEMKEEKKDTPSETKEEEKDTPSETKKESEDETSATAQDTKSVEETTTSKD